MELFTPEFGLVFWMFVAFAVLGLLSEVETEKMVCVIMLLMIFSGTQMLWTAFTPVISGKVSGSRPITWTSVFPQRMAVAKL